MHGHFHHIFDKKKGEKPESNNKTQTTQIHTKQTLEEKQQQQKYLDQDDFQCL